MKPQINLVNAILENPSRLRHIVRFSNCPRIHDESVAEHSFYTAFYVYLIGHALVMEGEELDLGAALGKAIMHDMDECYSGDFIRMFKHSDPMLKQQIDLACSKFMMRLSDEISDSPVTAGVIYDDWSSAKKGAEGKIVSFADFLSVLSYIAQELELGNVRMRRQLPELRKFHSVFKTVEYALVADYVEQAEQILDLLEKGETPNEE